MLSVYEIEAQVLCLGAAERAHLVERLLDSFETDSKIEKMWLNEVLRREEEVTSGKVRLVSGHEAIARIRAGIA